MKFDNARKILSHAVENFGNQVFEDERFKELVGESLDESGKWHRRMSFEGAFANFFREAGDGFMKLLFKLTGNTLVLMDRGISKAWLFTEIKAHGAHFLGRISSLSLRGACDEAMRLKRFRMQSYEDDFE